MSGGHFDINSCRLYWLCEEIQESIANNNVKDEYGYSRGYSEETLEKFKILIIQLEKTAKMLHLVDYLICSDTTEYSLEDQWPKDSV